MIQKNISLPFGVFSNEPDFPFMDVQMIANKYIEPLGFLETYSIFSLWYLLGLHSSTHILKIDS